MKQYTTTKNCAIDDQSLHYIDQQVARLEPYFDDPEDELPIFDIIVEKGKSAHAYLGSVTVFLPDASIHGQAESGSVAQSIHQAFEQLAAKITAYETDRQHRKVTAKKIFGDQLIPMTV